MRLRLFEKKNFIGDQTAGLGDILHIRRLQRLIREAQGGSATPTS